MGTDYSKIASSSCWAAAEQVVDEVVVVRFAWTSFEQIARLATQMDLHLKHSSGFVAGVGADDANTIAEPKAEVRARLSIQN